jgi:hypothetical protein
MGGFLIWVNEGVDFLRGVAHKCMSDGPNGIENMIFKHLPLLMLIFIAWIFN